MAAMAVLRDEGIQSLSQVQVSRRAEVRQSHLTYYFPKRHDLLRAVCVRFMDGMTDLLAGFSGQRPEDLLRRVGIAIAEQGHMRMFLGIIIEADSDPELRATVVAQTRRFEAALAELTGGGSPAELGRFLALLWGVGLYGLLKGASPDDSITPSAVSTLAEAARSMGDA